MSVIGILSICAIFGIGIFLRFGFSVVKNELLEFENKQLRKDLGKIQEEVEGLKKSFLLVSEKNRQIASILDIEAPEIGLGVGGRQLKFEKSGLLALNLIDSLKVALFVEKRLLEDSYNELLTRQEIIQYTPTIKPVKGYLTAGFGMRVDPFTGEFKPHLGVDISAPRGTPVVATANGVVKFAGFYHGYGKLVIIRHGTLFETWYAHLSTITVSPGNKVKRGDIIGSVGSTGITTGTHLHYEVHAGGRPTNPLNYFYPEIVVD